MLNFTKILQLAKIDQIIAFPIGCLIAFYYEPIANIFNARRVESLVCLLLLLTSFVFLLPPHPPDPLFKMLFIGMKAANSLLFCVSLILFVGRIGQFGYISRFLTICGLIAYEVYLIHGPLLIKYNPIIKLFSSDFIVISFTLFLSLVLILSYCIHKALRPLVK